MEKTRKQNKKTRCSQLLDDLHLCLSKVVPASRDQQQCKLISQAAPSSHSTPPYPPTPTDPASALPEGRGPARTQQHQKRRRNRKPSCRKDCTGERRLLRKSPFVFNGHVTWLVSYGVRCALSSSSKSTKFRGRKKKIIIAKDGQISQEALILKRENRGGGKWGAFPPRALRYRGVSEGRGWHQQRRPGSGPAAWQGLVAMVPSGQLARLHPHSLCHNSSCLVGSGRKEEKM